MLVLYIILGILALFVLLLFCSLTLTVDYDKKFTVRLGFLGMKWTLGKEKKQKPQKIKKEKGKTGAKKEAKEPSVLAMRFKEKNFLGKIRFIIDIAKKVVPELKYMLSRTRVRELSLDIRVGGSDAAKTAVHYGNVCSLVHPFLSWLQGFLDISMKRVNVSAAFGEEKSSARLHVKFKIRVIILLITAFKLIKIYLDLMEVPQNERKKHRFNH